MFMYVRVQAMSEVPALKFPLPPTRIVETLPAVMPPGSQHFAIQVASFETMSRAGRLVEQLAGAGYRARAVEQTVGEGVRIVEVLVGDYRSAAEAHTDLSALRTAHGFADAHIAPFFSPDAR
jgi:cell division septation protein DedD